MRTYLVTVVTDEGATRFPAIHAGAADAIQQAMALFPGARAVGAKPIRNRATG